MSNPNHFINERILNQVADGNTVAWMADRTRYDDGDEPGCECPQCGEIVPVSELKSDEVCNSCFKANNLVEVE